jgi:hypothetical protein
MGLGFAIRLLVIAAALWSSPCLAQSYFLWNDAMRSEGQYVAWIAEARVDVRWGTDQTTAVFEDAAVRVEGTISVDGVDDDGHPTSRLAVGVGEEVALVAESGWRIHMLPGTWAPVTGSRRGAVQVYLPEGMPLRRAWLPLPSAPAALEPVDDPWSWDAPALEERERRDAETEEKTDECFEDDLRPSAESGIRWREGCFEGETTRRIVSRGAWAFVRGYVDGFTIEGFRKKTRCTSGGDLRGIGISWQSASGDGCDPGGRRVWLAPGTNLYATPSSDAPFAVIKQRVEALETAPETGIMGCLSCADRAKALAALNGADPSLPPKTKIEVEHNDGRKRIRLWGYVKVARGSLAEMEPGAVVPCRLVGGTESRRVP